ncbi:hypothetical protein HID58_006376, partial [Brassica napus]
GAKKKKIKTPSRQYSERLSSPNTSRSKRSCRRVSLFFKTLLLGLFRHHDANTDTRNLVDPLQKMDIISQLQEQVNSIAAITFNVFGTLQRDAPPVQLSPNYPDPPPSAPTTDEPKQLSADLVKAAKQELKQVQELFGQAADNCLNLK